jgi:uncharacterized protein YecE (DUF72 family)
MQAETAYYIGTSGWTYGHWKGRFYPAELAKSRWFDFYCRHFNAVEINATLYRSFKPGTYQKWCDQAPSGFRYAVKAPRLISHRKKLIDCGQEIADFGEQAQTLKDHFGMILLQLAPSTTLDFARLRAALFAFPEPARVAVEFRNEKWERRQTCDLLKELGAVYVCVDSPAVALKAVLTGRRAYLRLHGRASWYACSYSQAELRQVVEIAQNLAAQGAEEIYVFFNNDFEGFAPRNALTLRELLGV